MNYTQLKTNIASYLHRTDQADNIPLFIQLLEAKVNREPALQDREFEVDLTATVGSREIAVPTGFSEAKAMWLTTFLPRERLIYLQPDDLPESIAPGIPTYWTIHGGDTIRMDSEADKAYTFVLSYTGSFELSDAFPTNWLLTNHPDIYLYGALLEASVFIRDEKFMGVWAAGYEKALQALKLKNDRAKALGELISDYPNNTRSNILEG